MLKTKYLNTLISINNLASMLQFRGKCETVKKMD